MECGSVVWAKMTGYPWWPAMIDDDPDYNTFCWPKDSKDHENRTDYHVVFLDEEVSRQWVTSNNICLFKGKDTPDSMGSNVCKGKDYSSRVQAAYTRAKMAVQMPIKHRISTYGLLARWSTSKFYESDSDGIVHLYPGPERKKPRRKKLVKRIPKKAKSDQENRDTSSGKDDQFLPKITSQKRDVNNNHKDEAKNTGNRRKVKVNFSLKESPSSSSSTSLELVDFH